MNSMVRFHLAGQPDTRHSQSQQLQSFPGKREIKNGREKSISNVLALRCEAVRPRLPIPWSSLMWDLMFLVPLPKQKLQH